MKPFTHQDDLVPVVTLLCRQKIIMTFPLGLITYQLKTHQGLEANLKGNSRGSLELQKCDLEKNGLWLLPYSGCLSC